MISSEQELKRFRAVLSNIYGDSLQKVVLFGSRARGDSRPDSDYDVAVFLNSMPDRWVELDKLANLSAEFVLQTGLLINSLPYHASKYHELSPLMGEIRHDGIEI